MAEQPQPFEIVSIGDGSRVASNGAARLMLLHDRGRMFRRRGIKRAPGRPAGEALLPELNRLAGDLLARLDMPAEELCARLLALAAVARPVDPQRIEWVVAELDGVRVYSDGADVIVTDRDLEI